MLRLIFIALMSLLVLNCGGLPNDWRIIQVLPDDTKDPRWIKSIGEEFLPYYISFKDDCGIKPRIAIGLDSSMSSPTAGLCWNWRSRTKNYKQISINLDFWKTATETEKEWLVYHELGHCLLNKEHSKTGIMQPVIDPISVKEYKYDKKPFIQRLCGGNND